MELIFPTIEHKEAVLAYRKEWLDIKPNERIHGSCGLQNPKLFDVAKKAVKGGCFYV